MNATAKFRRKLQRIRAEVGKIEKRGIDDSTGNPYTRIEDILDAVNPLLDKYGLVFTGELAPEQSPVFHQLAKGCVRDVVMLFTLEDVATGHTKSWRVPGSGWKGLGMADDLRNAGVPQHETVTGIGGAGRAGGIAQCLNGTLN